MSLPILPSRPAVGIADLIRYYHRCELHWCQQIAEQTPLDVGTALVNASLAEVWDANVVFDAALPEGVSAADAVAEADAHFRSQGSKVCKWVPNIPAPQDRTAPLADHLLSAGFARHTHDIMHLSGQPAGVIEEVGGLRIIPARASFRHARVLAEESAAAITPQVADAFILHLEDPHTDGLLAMKGDEPVAFVTVLTIGEIGCITELYVAQRFRRLGIGRTMMSRALEICARSLFKHVFLSCEPQNGPAISLYRKLGFEKIGDFICYVRA
jgi:GNAT superfamily N-acetyltransferase